MTKERIMRLDEVASRCGLHRATIDRRVIAGTFPPKVNLGGNAVGWYESQIDEWISDPAGYQAPARAA